jgi:chemotaxis protein CheZ
VQRKVFRVEQMFAHGRAGARAADPAERQHVVDELKALRALAEHHDAAAADVVQNLQHELALISDAIARNKRELCQLIGEGEDRRMPRAAGELAAAVNCMEKATETILKSVEIVDDNARALASARMSDYERGLAEDIQDHVVQIYEACNFQDLAGQRIGNAIRTLHSIEDQVVAMLDRCTAVSRKTPAEPKPAPASDDGLLNGPRLDGDGGHASQSDIDMMFD